jgi:hypothetical protein
MNFSKSSKVISSTTVKRGPNVAWETRAVSAQGFFLVEL